MDSGKPSVLNSISPCFVQTHEYVEHNLKWSCDN